MFTSCVVNIKVTNDYFALMLWSFEIQLKLMQLKNGDTTDAIYCCAYSPVVCFLILHLRVFLDRSCHLILYLIVISKDKDLNLCCFLPSVESMLHISMRRDAMTTTGQAAAAAAESLRRRWWFSKTCCSEEKVEKVTKCPVDVRVQIHNLHVGEKSF